MSAKIIATIKLAPGQVGFYDPLSRIHLTLGNPTATVYSGTNCAALRRNVKAGIIRILDGTLGNDVAPFKIVKVGDKYKLASNSVEENKPVYAEEAAPKKEEAKEQVAVEITPVITPEVKEEAVAAAEEPSEEAVEAPVEEEDAVEEEAIEEAVTAKKKRASRKKTAQKTEE